MLSTQLIQQLHERIEQCYLIAEQALNIALPRPTVLINQRGKIAGSALLQKNTLKFHPQLYHQNQSHFLKHVVAHEIAHLIVWQLVGRAAPHGKQWQHIMLNVFGLPANRTHQYNTDNIGIKQMIYYCDCGEVPLSMRRHNKVVTGVRYRCRVCSHTLELKHPAQ